MNTDSYRDYFKVLGVNRDASSNEIKSAFRRLARKFHPDVNPGNKQAEGKFKEINEAYEVLSDPQKKRKYEQFGQFWNQSSGIGSGIDGLNVDFGSYSNFDDFVNDLLGRFVGGRGREGFAQSYNQSSDEYRKPANLDVQIILKITFSEAFWGTQRTLSVNEEPVEVRIPGGVVNGTRLRVKGKGNLQLGTGRRGNILINLQVENHKVWQLDGDQLKAELPVSYDELLLGSIVTAMTPDGETQLTIPARTLPGSSLRLKDKGWPINNGRGDLILTLALCFPSCLSSKEIDLLNQLRELRISDPRKDWINSARL